MDTTRRAFAGPGELEAALAFVRVCRAADMAVPWPSLSELRLTLAALPAGAAHAQVWEDARGLMALALLWDDSVLVTAIHPWACTEAMELDLLRWGWATATGEARRRGERPCLFVPVRVQDHARAALLEREGFAADEWRTLLMCRPLALPLPEAPLAPGFRVRPAGARVTTAVLALHNEIFVGLPKTRSEQRALRHAGSYRPALDLVAVAPDGRLAAYCLGSVSPDDGPGASCLGSISPDDGPSASAPVGWIERVGVRVAFRQRGLGRALVTQALRAMRAEGLERALLTTGASNDAARRLFAACGFHSACAISWYVRGEV